MQRNKNNQNNITDNKDNIQKDQKINNNIKKKLHIIKNNSDSDSDNKSKSNINTKIVNKSKINNKLLHNTNLNESEENESNNETDNINTKIVKKSTINTKLENNINTKIGKKFLINNKLDNKIMTESDNESIQSDNVIDNNINESDNDSIQSTSNQDMIIPDIKQIRKQVLYLQELNKKSPKQRSKEWYELRKMRITASDAGCITGVNKYEPKYKFIIKKVADVKFEGYENTHHGTKYERIATMIYESRKNVIIDEYQLLTHSQYKFIGASPDGIVGLYTNDKKTFTNLVGRLLEIKCPRRRQIKFTGKLFDIVPEYYWAQVQLQLECCNLYECDFLQCELFEYSSRQDYINDTLYDDDNNDTYKSKETKNEKGCIIQLLPIKNESQEYINYSQEKYYEYLSLNALFLYPPKLNMNIQEYDEWYIDMSLNFKSVLKEQIYEKKSDYYIDKIIYWRLNKQNCTLIKRNTKWFEQMLPIFEQTWNHVLFFREYNDYFKILQEYIQSVTQYKYNFFTKKNESYISEENCNKILEVIEKLYKIPNSYKNTMKTIKDEIIHNNNNNNNNN